MERVGGLAVTGIRPVMAGKTLVGVRVDLVLFNPVGDERWLLAIVALEPLFFLLWNAGNRHGFIDLRPAQRLDGTRVLRTGQTSEQGQKSETCDCKGKNGLHGFNSCRIRSRGCW